MKRYDSLIGRVIELYPKNVCELNHSSAYELLVAVILSAQCTDKRVNLVTSKLFNVANTPDAMIALGEEKLKKIIRPCGFYNSKAKNIMLATKAIISEHDGIVPSNFNSLVKLNGVGEKTASVVQAVWYKIPAFAVDTHVFRVSKRLGFTKMNTPHDVMMDLKKKISKNLWIDGHFALVLHGRYCCVARSPKCESCSLCDICKFKKYKKEK